MLDSLLRFLRTKREREEQDQVILIDQDQERFEEQEKQRDTQIKRLLTLRSIRGGDRPTDHVLFLRLCEANYERLEFFGVDVTLLMLCFEYFRRAKISSAYFSRDLLFAGVHLAAAMEDDHDEVRDRILEFYCGSKPLLLKRRKSNGVRRLRTPAYREYLRKADDFLNIKDQLWKELDYRLWIRPEECLNVMKEFPRHEIFQLSFQTPYSREP